MGHLWPAKISKQQHYFRNKFVKYNKDPIWQACTVPVVLIDSATNKYFFVFEKRSQRPVLVNELSEVFTVLDNYTV